MPLSEKARAAALARIEMYQQSAAPARPIFADKGRRCYEVGKRGQYVYWLVQGCQDMEERGLLVAQYTAKFRLTDEETAHLMKALADLDTRRSRPKAPAKPVDPYWSLWGKLKARLEQDEDIEDLCDPGIVVLDHIAEELVSSRRPLLLPLRKVAVEYDGANLIVGGRRKSINSDSHAVASLRKLDTNDAYFDTLKAEVNE